MVIQYFLVNRILIFTVYSFSTRFIHINFLPCFMLNFLPFNFYPLFKFTRHTECRWYSESRLGTLFTASLTRLIFCGFVKCWARMNINGFCCIILATLKCLRLGNIKVEWLKYLPYLVKRKVEVARVLFIMFKRGII